MVAAIENNALGSPNITVADRIVPINYRHIISYNHYARVSVVSGNLLIHVYVLRCLLIQL